MYIRDTGDVVSLSNVVQCCHSDHHCLATRASNISWIDGWLLPRECIKHIIGTYYHGQPFVRCPLPVVSPAAFGGEGFVKRFRIHLEVCTPCHSVINFFYAMKRKEEPNAEDHFTRCKAKYLLQYNVWILHDLTKVIITAKGVSSNFFVTHDALRSSANNNFP